MLSPEEWRTFFSYLQRTQHSNLLCVNIVDTVIIDDEGDIIIWLFTGKDGKILKKNADKRTAANLKRSFSQRAMNDRTNYLDNVAIERCMTAKVLRDAEFEALMRQMDKDKKLRAMGSIGGHVGKRPYCIQQYIAPYQGLRYVSACDFLENGDVQQSCFASPAPYGVLGDPVELFNCAPSGTGKESPAMDPTLTAELKDCMIRIAKHVHERSGESLSRLVAEFIMDRFGKVFLQTVAHYEWRVKEAKAGEEPTEAPEAPHMQIPLPVQPSDRAPRQVIPTRPSRPGHAPRGRPSTARIRQTSHNHAPVPQGSTRRPQSARTSRSLVARSCRDNQVVELSKALQTTDKQVESLSVQIRQAKAESDSLKEELKQKEQDAQVLRLNMKREWESAIDSRQGGAKGDVNNRLMELTDLVKTQQQHFGVSMSRSMLMFRDELMRVHQEFDRRDRDNLARIRGLETTVQTLNADLERNQHANRKSKRSFVGGTVSPHHHKSDHHT